MGAATREGATLGYPGAEVVSRLWLTNLVKGLPPPAAIPPVAVPVPKPVAADAAAAAPTATPSPSLAQPKRPRKGRTAPFVNAPVDHGSEHGSDGEGEGGAAAPEAPPAEAPECPCGAGQALVRTAR